MVGERSSVSSGFFRHKPSAPCPACGGKRDCRTSYSSGLIFCRHTPPGSEPYHLDYVKTDVHGFHLFAPSNGDRATDAEFSRRVRESNANHRAARQAARGTGQKPVAPAKSNDFERIAATKKPLPQHRARLLSWQLFGTIVPEEFFACLDVQWVDDTGWGKPAWVIPERSGEQEVIGFNLRHLDGKKITVGQRGIFIPANWSSNDPDPNAPIYLPEGASDTMALTLMGKNAVGRPNDKGGLDHLAKLLDTLPYSRPIVVVGESDRKENGTWPGMAGAAHIKKGLNP